MPVREFPQPARRTLTRGRAIFEGKRPMTKDNHLLSKSVDRNLSLQHLMASLMPEVTFKILQLARRPLTRGRAILEGKRPMTKDDHLLERR